MRTIHAALLGGVVGAAVGAPLGGRFLSAGSAQTAPASPIRAEPDASVGRATLEAGEAPDPSRRTAPLPLDLARYGRRVLPPETPDQPWRGALWRGLVGALLDKEEPAVGLAALEAAFAAGVTAEEIATLLPVLEAPLALEVLRWLHARRDALVASPLLAARIAEAVGARGDAFERALEALKTVPTGMRASIAILARIDPARANEVVSALAKERNWPTGNIQEAAHGFVDACAGEVATRWSREAAARVEREAGVLAERLVAEAEATNDAGAWGNAAYHLAKLPGRTVEAIRAFERALRLDPGDESSVRHLARLDLLTARPYLEAMARGAPSVEALEWLARARLRAGDDAGAMEVLLRLPYGDLDPWWASGAAALAPQPALARLDTQLKSSGAQRSGLLHAARGDALAALGRNTEAFDAYAQAIRVANSGGYDFEGDHAVRRMIAIDPRGTAAFLDAMPADSGSLRDTGHARVEAALGRPAPLRAILERIAEYTPDARVELAALVGSPWREDLERAARETPDQVEVHALLASMHELRGQRAEARAAYERAADLDPEDLGFLVRAALLR